MRTRRVIGRGDSGASAVEFALVVPVLLLLVFGIIDYGLWFSDSVAARSGVREGARQGVVQNFGTCQELRCLADLTRQRTGTAAGTQWVRIIAPSWKRGENLTVCAMVKVNGVTGLTPLPSDGLLATAVTMRIEQDDSPPTDGPMYTDPGAPSSWQGSCAS